MYSHLKLLMIRAMLRRHGQLPVVPICCDVQALFFQRLDRGSIVHSVSHYPSDKYYYDLMNYPISVSKTTGA